MYVTSYDRGHRVEKEGVAMKKECVRFRAKRLFGYVLGFLLFYAPFDLFARAVDCILPPTQLYSIHEPCFRIPLHEILSGHIGEAGPVSLIAMVLLLFVSLLFGPLFCGKLCPAGALPEYLSRLVPQRVKIDWAVHVPVIPIRYGFFAGFLLSSLAGITEHCAYCNFYVFDLLITFFHTGRVAVYSVSLLATFIVWFVVLGIFTKGGRGFCLFLCPVGACSTFIHAIGVHVPGTFAMHVQADRCVGCKRCAETCPMRAIQVQDHTARVGVHQCIICQECEKACPKQAISYGRQ
jgi:polyferredoxin